MNAHLHFADALHLPSWIVGRMDTFLKAQCRILIGWDETVKGGLSPGTVVMSWMVSLRELKQDALALAMCSLAYLPIASLLSSLQLFSCSGALVRSGRVSPERWRSPGLLLDHCCAPSAAAYLHDNRVLVCPQEMRTVRGSLESRPLVQGISGGVKAAKAGHEVIMTPTSHCYFDYRQSLK